MFDNDRDEREWEYLDSYYYMHGEPKETQKKNSPIPFFVFAIIIVIIHLIGGSTYSTPIGWIGIIVLLILRFIAWI